MLQAKPSALTSISDLLAKGKQAALSGNRELAREQLAYVVYLDPSNAEGWLWLSGVVDFPQQVRYCLERTLRIDPDNERALQGVEWLNARQREIDEARAAAERVKPYWQTSKPKPLLNLIKKQNAQTVTASGETPGRLASWTAVSMSIPTTRAARSNAPTTPVSAATLERMTAGPPETAQDANRSYTEAVLADNDELAPRFVTNVATHHLVSAIKKVTGDPGTAAILKMAGLEEFGAVTPAPEETPGINYTSFGRLGEATEEFYDQAVMPMQVRVGREMFRIELAGKGKMAAMKTVAFKLMSPEKKLRAILEELADGHARMGMEAYFEEHDDGFLFALETCPYCFGRLTNARCNVTVGFLTAGIEWATGRTLAIKEVTCRGVDEAICSYWIATA